MYGYDEDNQIPDPDTGTVYTEARRFRPAGTVIGRDTMAAPIYIDTIMESLRGLDTESRQSLAMEMFAFVPGAYRDVEDIMRDGVIDEESYYYAIQQTIQLAESYGPEGIADNPLFIDILMGDGERSAEEVQQAFMARAAQLAAARRRPGGSGGGRIINYIDPVALAGAAKNGFAGVTGRKATKAEQQEFVKLIHGLQAKGASGIDVAGRAEAFAQSSAPTEAGAMEYSQAANLVMNAIGL